MKKLLILFPVVLLLASSCSTANTPLSGNGDKGGKSSSTDDSVYCTMDAKLCPDGSYVGRVPPKCEFAACPAAGSGKTGATGIRGVAMLGPTCPVERIPPDEQCADKPYKTSLVVTTADQSRVIKTFQTGDDGKFSVEVPEGDYAIRSAAATNLHPYCSSSGTITVKANTFTEVTVNCDTGIR